MASTIPAIDADGHIFEQQSEIRNYLDDRWKGRETPLWPGGQSWDIELSGRNFLTINISELFIYLPE